MAPRERPADRGARRGRTIVASLCEEVRRGRIGAGLPQHAVARALRISRSRYGRMERGQSANVSVVELSRALAVVGLELSARAYPEATALRDAGHVRVLARFGAMLPSSADWRTEAPFPIAGDLRSWDGFIRLPDVSGVECEMRPTDWQELTRRINRKQRDGGVDRVIVVMPNTRSNRSFLQDHAEDVAVAFPVAGREAMAALQDGRDPGGDALVLV